MDIPDGNTKVIVSGGAKVLKIVGGVFSCVGIMLLAGAAWSGNRQYTILKKWPSVDALVTQSRVTHHESTSDSSSGGSSTTMYRAEIEFRYSVAGREYTTPVNSSYDSSSYSEMKRQADTYAPGTTHSIRYNPADPNDIRYDVGYHFMFFFLPVLLGGMGLVFTAVGIGLWAAAGVAKRARSPRVCPSCGQRVERGENFCPHCAAPLPIQ